MPATQHHNNLRRHYEAALSALFARNKPRFQAEVDRAIEACNDHLEAGGAVTIFVKCCWRLLGMKEWALS